MNDRGCNLAGQFTKLSGCLGLVAAFTKLTYVSEVKFGNFLIPKTHNFAM
jgi:hypothetical protein